MVLVEVVLDGDLIAVSLLLVLLFTFKQSNVSMDALPVLQTMSKVEVLVEVCMMETLLVFIVLQGGSVLLVGHVSSLQEFSKISFEVGIGGLLANQTNSFLLVAEEVLLLLLLEFAQVDVVADAKGVLPLLLPLLRERAGLLRKANAIRQVFLEGNIVSEGPLARDGTDEPEVNTLVGA